MTSRKRRCGIVSFARQWNPSWRFGHRLPAPDDVAAGCVFLTPDLASYVIGIILSIGLQPSQQGVGTSNNNIRSWCRLPAKLMPACGRTERLLPVSAVGNNVAGVFGGSDAAAGIAVDDNAIG
jgi:hypothetical protein